LASCWSYRTAASVTLPVTRTVSHTVSQGYLSPCLSLLMLSPLACVQRPRKVKKSGGSKRGRSWRAREREPITGVWGRSPQRGPSAEPLVRGRSRPEADKLFAFRRPLEGANLRLFSVYCKLSKSLKFSIQH